MKKVIMLCSLLSISGISAVGLYYADENPITCNDVRRMVKETEQEWHRCLEKAKAVGGEQNQSLKDVEIAFEWFCHLNILESIDSLCDNPFDAKRMRESFLHYKKPLKKSYVDFPYARKAAYKNGLRLVDGLEKNDAAAFVEK